MATEQVSMDDILHEIEIRNIEETLENLKLGESCNIKGNDIKYIGIKSEFPFYGRKGFKYRNGIAFGAWNLAGCLYFNNLSITGGKCRLINGHSVLWELN